MPRRMSTGTEESASEPAMPPCTKSGMTREIGTRTASANAIATGMSTRRPAGSGKRHPQELVDAADRDEAHAVLDVGRDLVEILPVLLGQKHDADAGAAG